MNAATSARLMAESVELAEAVGGQPVVAYGGGAGGHHPQVVREGVDQIAQPAPGALALALGDLVHAVDQQQRPPGCQYAVGPAAGLRAARRVADGGEEAGGGGQRRAVAGEGAQREDEGDPAVEVGQGRLAGGLVQETASHWTRVRLAGAGDPAQQHPLVAGQGLVGGDGSGAGGPDRGAPSAVKGRCRAPRSRPEPSPPG